MKARPLAVLLALLPLAAACAPPELMIHTEPADPTGYGTLLVVNGGAASVSLVDALTGDRIIDLPVGEGPADIAVSPDGRLAVVANRGGAVPGSTLSVIDVAAAAVLGDIELGLHARPGAVQFLSDGRRVLAVSGSSGQLLLLDVVARRLVRAVSTGQARSERLALQPDGERVWITHGDGGVVTEIDVDSLQIIDALVIGAESAGLDVRPDGEEVWVCDPSGDTISIIDTVSRKVVDTLPCGGGPVRLRFTPDGQRAIVSCSRSADVAVFTVGQPRLLGRIPLVLTSLEAGDSRLFGHPLPAGTSPDVAPSDVLPSNNNQRVWVSHPLANFVTVIDLDHLDIRGRDRSSQQPLGLGWSMLVPGQY